MVYRENHSKAGHDYQIIKQPKTYEQQVELIKEKRLYSE